MVEGGDLAFSVAVFNVSRFRKLGSSGVMRCYDKISELNGYDIVMILLTLMLEQDLTMLN